MKRILCCLTVCMLLLVLYPAMPTQAEESAVQTVEVGIPVEEHPELFLTRSMPTHGEGKIAVFLIEFPDYPNENPVATQEYYDKLYFSGGLETSWENTTVAEFYREQSYGKLNLSGQVFDWYTAKHERSYYDHRKAELIMEAAEYYQNQGVDFSQFDGDGDGILDAIAFHFSGDCSVETDDPWYSGVCYTQPYGFGTIDGLRFQKIVQVYEGANKELNNIISIVCHELMHTLGMPDLYGERWHPLVAVNDLMSKNEPMINPYTKMLLGWQETVQVITSDTENIRLDLYGTSENGKAVIVTDEYKGLFDEFYMVAFRMHGLTVWHIDARLNENGTAFAYQNLYYVPRPDQNTDDEAYISRYLFIEEITENPDRNYIFGNAGLFGDSIYTEESVFGPNSVPSSDTHDGEYTGIRMDRFMTNDKGHYMTFDVSFVKDNDAPEVAVNEKKLVFQEVVKIPFNEYIYAGEKWEQIQVTDMEGNLLNATVILPHYPNHEIEISFRDNAYKSGYKIVFPQDAVRDSSGNPMKAVTLTASSEKVFFPKSETQLPSSAYSRANHNAEFFADEDGFLVITELWVDNVRSRKIEFMHLDYNGNVLSQTIVDNPIENTIVVGAVETGDGNYILNLRDTTVEYGGGDILVCMDGNGNLKWINDAFSGTGKVFTVGEGNSQNIKTDHGVILLVEDTNAQNADGRHQLVHIDSENGQVETIPDSGKLSLSYKPIFDLSNGKMLFQDYGWIGRWNGLNIQILDVNTWDVLADFFLEEQQGVVPVVRMSHMYDDGTVLLICDMDDYYEVMWMDAELNLLKSVSMDESLGDYIAWFDDDGFCYADRQIIGNHSNSVFHVSRYDRYLNLMWKTDVEANFVYYFQSSNGDIMAYRSMWEPEQECYIDYYGSEQDFRVPHVHELVHTAKVSPTCQKKGMAEYWQCKLCGCFFSDNGETVVTSLKALELARIAHQETLIPGVAPTCTQTGLSEGKKCSVCGKIVVAQQSLPRTDHIEQTVPAVAPTCTESGLSEWKQCADCGMVLVPSREIPATGHINQTQDNYCDVCGAELCKAHNIITLSSKEPTCHEDGLTEGKKCKYCGMVFVAQKTIPKLEHVEKVVPAVAPTCSKPGATEGSKCTLCGLYIVFPQEIPATGEHLYGEWKVIKEPTCTEEGTQRRRCACAKSETRAIPPAHSGTWTVVREATLTETGLEEMVCKFCGALEQRVIPMMEAEPATPTEPAEPNGGNLVVPILVGVAILLVIVSVVVIVRKKK